MLAGCDNYHLLDGRPRVGCIIVVAIISSLHADMCLATPPDGKAPSSYVSTSLNFALPTGSVPSGTISGGSGTTSLLEAAPRRQMQRAEAVLADGMALTRGWEVSLVAQSFVAAALGAYASLLVVGQARETESGRAYALLLALAGLSLGCGSIWAVHFACLSAVQFAGAGTSSTNGGIRVVFSPALTASSGLVACLITVSGLHIGVGAFRPNAWLGTRHWGPTVRLSAAAVIVGMGSCTTFYMATRSVQSASGLGVVYIPWLVAVCAVASTGACVIGLSGGLLRGWACARSVASLMFGAAIIGAHFCGVASTTFSIDWGMADYCSYLACWSISGQDVVIVAVIMHLFVMLCYGARRDYIARRVRRLEAVLDRKMREEDCSHDAKKNLHQGERFGFPMVVLTYHTFLKAKRLVDHETLRDRNELIFLDTPRAATELFKSGTAVFFSHQWLSTSEPDPWKRLFEEMVAALKTLTRTVDGVHPDKLYIWLECSSIPQSSKGQRQLALDSLPTYAWLCSVFVVVAPDTVHAQSGVPRNFESYSHSFECRLDVLCAVMNFTRPRPEEVESPPRASRSASTLTWNEVDSENEPSMMRVSACRSDGGTRARTGLGTRFFVSAGKTLERLNLFSMLGDMEPDYEHFLYPYDVEPECCRQGHRKDEADEYSCKRWQAVNMLTTSYGVMLSNLMRPASNTTSDSDYIVRRAVAKQVVRSRDRIFPAMYFDAKIEAIHRHVVEEARQLPVQESEGSPEDESDSFDAWTAEGLGRFVGNQLSEGGRWLASRSHLAHVSSRSTGLGQRGSVRW